MEESFTNSGLGAEVSRSAAAGFVLRAHKVSLGPSVSRFVLIGSLPCRAQECKRFVREHCQIGSNPDYPWMHQIFTTLVSHRSIRAV